MCSLRSSGCCTLFARLYAAWQLSVSAGPGGVVDPLPLIGCSSNPNKMDHGVAVVGYGSANKDYWIIKKYRLLPLAPTQARTTIDSLLT